MDDAARSLGLTPGAHAAARAPAAAAARPADGRAAGVHRRDEGAAGHAGDAAVQLRHAGHAGLHAGVGRAAGRGLDRDARDRGRGAAAADRAVPADRPRPALSRSEAGLRQPRSAPAGAVEDASAPAAVFGGQLTDRQVVRP